jgi:2-oxoglutarate ferredoxin oxidoreductase subunit delta
MPKITLFPDSCKGVEDCGICIFVCPRKVLVESDEMNETGYVPPEVSDEDLCTGCQNCMIYCPDFAIAVEKGPRRPSHKAESEDE